MKLNSLLMIVLVALNLTACSTNGQGVKNLNSNEFEKGAAAKGVQLVDVRTPEEYSEKRIAGSVNYNVNGPDFEKQMAGLDKTKPLYLYCLSGGRSGNAAQWAVKNGFKEVYNLNGGITAWMADKKEVETATGKPVSGGISFDEYLAKLKVPGKLVLVDFNAVWCAPCKILKPIAQKVTRAHADKVELLDIDVDKNPDVATTMNIRGIPLIVLYKDGKEVWRNLGLTDEATLVAKVNEFSNSKQ